jgi:hypothetical protein
MALMHSTLPAFVCRCLVATLAIAISAVPLHCREFGGPHAQSSRAQTTVHSGHGYVADKVSTNEAPEPTNSDGHTVKGCCIAVCCALLPVHALHIYEPKVQIAAPAPALDVAWPGAIFRIYKPPKFT